jgi:hypothetical protein
MSPRWQAPEGIGPRMIYPLFICLPNVRSVLLYGTASGGRWMSLEGPPQLAASFIASDKYPL